MSDRGHSSTPKRNISEVAAILHTHCVCYNSHFHSYHYMQVSVFLVSLIQCVLDVNNIHPTSALVPTIRMSGAKYLLPPYAFIKTLLLHATFK